jgi:hypothetical protein
MRTAKTTVEVAVCSVISSKAGYQRHQASELLSLNLNFTKANFHFCFDSFIALVSAYLAGPLSVQFPVVFLARVVPFGPRHLTVDAATLQTFGDITKRGTGSEPREMPSRSTAVCTRSQRRRTDEELRRVR